MCVHEFVCTICVQVPTKTQKQVLGFRFPGTGGIDSCEPSNVGAGNQMGFSPRIVSAPKCSSHLLLVKEE